MGNFLTHIGKILPEDEIKDFADSCNLPVLKSIRFFSYANNQKKKVGYNGDFYKIENKIDWTEDGFYLEKNSKPSKSLDYIRGDFYIQDASSMYPVASLKKIIPNNIDINYILDYAASPGGKTTQLADYFPTSIILANEVIKGRINAILSNLVRSKLKNVILLNKDFQFYKDLSLKFDVILADLPCSGESLIYKKKTNISDWNLNEVLFNAKRQKKISGDLLNLLNENSYFLYSTCTFSKEENEDIVDFLIENNLNLIHQKRLWPHKERCAGGFSAILKKENTKNNDKNIINQKNTNKKLEFIENQNEKVIKILIKNPYFDIDKILNCGYLYLKGNTIFLFSFPKIIKPFFENAISIGQAIAKLEKYGTIPLWGSIDYVKKEFILKYDKKTLYKFSEGSDLKELNLKIESKTNNQYFIAADDESSLFLLKITENGIKNLIPNFMIVR
jgi:16S rRNA C967 or C1407 C5-methylase (RsmB/RsmF family)